METIIKEKVSEIVKKFEEKNIVTPDDTTEIIKKACEKLAGTKVIETAKIHYVVHLTIIWVLSVNIEVYKKTINDMM